METDRNPSSHEIEPRHTILIVYCPTLNGSVNPSDGQKVTHIYIQVGESPLFLLTVMFSQEGISTC